MSQKQKKKDRKHAARRGKAKTSSVGPIRKDAQGRMHLLVERDARGRAQRVQLARPLFQEGWQNDVASAAASTTHGMLEGGPTEVQAVRLGLSAMAGVSKIINGVLAQARGEALACRPGCSHCCYQAVGVSVPEVLAIYQHLKATLSAQAFEQVLTKVRAADDKTRGLNQEERLSPEYPCPFLDEKRCSIYEVRPLACRGKNSLDAEACRVSLYDSEARSEFLRGTFAVPSFLEPIRAFHAVAAGLQLALHELYQLHVLPLELTAAFRVLADAPEALPEAWLQGHDAFHEARGGDASKSPFIREVTGRR